jgi:hypothetical protein
MKKKDFKALFIIHQSVSPYIFEKVSDCESSKQAWDILAIAYGGGEKLKKVRLKTLRRQYKLIQMEDKETVSDFFTRISKLVNSMKSCGELISSQNRVEKILRSLSSRFDSIVVSIEESKDSSVLTVDELQGSLEVHEQRMNERNLRKEKEVALNVNVQQNNGKDKKGKGKWNNNKRRGGYQNSNAKENQESSSNNNGGRSGRGYRGGRGGRGGRNNGNYKFDNKNLQCYNCQKYGHFADECRSKEDTNETEAKLARDDDDEGLQMLMVTTKEESECSDQWYLDTGCSTHISSKRDWFISLKGTHNHNVKFANDSIMIVQGTGDVSIRRRDGKHAVISGVFTYLE